MTCCGRRAGIVLLAFLAGARVSCRRAVRESSGSEASHSRPGPPPAPGRPAVTVAGQHGAGSGCAAGSAAGPAGPGGASCASGSRSARSSCARISAPALSFFSRAEAIALHRDGCTRCGPGAVALRAAPPATPCRTPPRTPSASPAAARRSRASRRDLEQSRRETAAVSQQRDDLLNRAEAAPPDTAKGQEKG